MDDQQLLRYSRHILLEEIDFGGQEKLLNAHILIIGVGGLGCPAALYLAASGVGHLTLVDHDTVELSNLQRQIAHTEKQIGQPKPESARLALQSINSGTRITTINKKLAGEDLLLAISSADLVLDCSDNLETRFEINAACVTLKKPLISGAAIQWEGQIIAFDSRNPESACYRCLYNPTSDQHLTCSESGVVAPIVGIVGSIQALEAIKLLADAGTALVNRLLLFDGKQMQWREIKLKKDPQCPCCGKKN